MVNIRFIDAATGKTLREKSLSSRNSAMGGTWTAGLRIRTLYRIWGKWWLNILSLQFLSKRIYRSRGRSRRGHQDFLLEADGHLALGVGAAGNGGDADDGNVKKSEADTKGSQRDHKGIVDMEIKKTVGREKSKRPLKRLQELNDALKKLGCEVTSKDNATEYRKIVGRG